MINLNNFLIMSVISIRDRVVDTIARSIDWCKEGNSLPYTIAFVAEEPHCIVRIERMKVANDNVTSYMYYRVDGGILKKMERSRWSDLWDEYRFGPKEYENVVSTMNDEINEEFYGDEYQSEAQSQATTV
jgi:hypothetical protein